MLSHEPTEPAQGRVLVLPGFAEEMNKCRAMVTRVARTLESRGIATTVVDYFGTGDSEGDFSDGSIETWTEDAAALIREYQDGRRFTSVLAIRFGALLLSDMLEKNPDLGLERTVLWQPVLDGKRFLTQFLRLGVAAAMARGERASTSGIVDRLRSNGRIEVAGYCLTSGIADALSQMTIRRIGPQWGSVCWIENSVGDAGALSVASQAVVDASVAMGGTIQIPDMRFEPFWMSNEILVDAAIVDASSAWLCPAGRTGSLRKV